MHHAVDRTARASELSRRHGEPGYKAKALGFAVSKGVLRLAVGDVVEVLHRHDLHELTSRFDLRDRHLGEAHGGDLSFTDQVRQQTELLFLRDLRVDAMELEQVEPLDAQPAQAHLSLLTEVLGSAYRYPHIGTGAYQAGLGRDQQVLGVGVQCFADQLLAHVRSIGIGGVDEVDSQLDCPAQHADCLGAVLRLPQISGPVSRMAPKPSRWTVLSPSRKVPLGLTSVSTSRFGITSDQSARPAALFPLARIARSGR